VITKFSGEYDFAIVNHTTTWERLPDDLPKVFTSHSKIFQIEQPPCKAYVGVNESIGGTIIRNGIDCDRFKPTNTNTELKNILLLSNPLYSGGMDFVYEATRGYNLIILPEQTFHIEHYIEKADLVISLSRGALEAMACGKNVIYGDYRKDWMGEFQAYGMITEENFEDFKTGKAREQLRPFSIEELRSEFNKYKAIRGKWLREQIEENFNIEKTAQQYIELYEKNSSCVRIQI
jgi:hypothetical protein